MHYLSKFITISSFFVFLFLVAGLQLAAFADPGAHVLNNKAQLSDGTPAVGAAVTLTLESSTTNEIFDKLQTTTDSTGAYTLDYQKIFDEGSAKSAEEICHTVLVVETSKEIHLSNLSSAKPAVNVLAPKVDIHFQFVIQGAVPVANQEIYIQRCIFAKNHRAFAPYDKWKAAADANGMVSFSDVPKCDSYVVSMVNPTLSCDQVKNPDNADIIRFDVQAHSVIKGRVVNFYTNKPLSGCAVRAQKAVGGEYITVASTHTNKKGEYQFDRLSAGTFRLTIDDSGKAEEQNFDFSDDPEDFTPPSLKSFEKYWTMLPTAPVELSQGKLLTMPDLKAVHGGLIMGIVSDEKGNAISDDSRRDLRIEFKLLGSFPKYSNGFAGQISDDGYYYAHVRPGGYQVSIIVDKAKRQEDADKTVIASGAQIVQVTDKETKNITLQLSKSQLENIKRFTVNGKVVDQNGKPVAGSTVECFRPNLASVLTDTDGKFVLINCSASTLIYAFNSKLATKEPIAPTSAAPNCTVKIVPGALCTVSGTLTNKAGVALPNTKISIFPEIGRENDTQSVDTDESGHFSFQVCPGLKYQFSAKDIFWTPVNKNQNLEAGQTYTETVKTMN
jgi:protocatechuate 3,4-dioxygenase beta subunit